MKVLLDTNALMVPGQFGLDIFEELERLGYRRFLVPRPVLLELESLARRADSRRDRIAARIGLKLTGGCELVEAFGEADGVLVVLALEADAAVFTNDKELKKKLSTRGVTVIHLRQRRYLDIASGRSSDV
ncbi:MAG TPA: DNA-binding protein [Methanotrichaceae archaeon]|nr:DNA-binding protein [Methanotrichaceae archaeon]